MAEDNMSVEVENAQDQEETSIPDGKVESNNGNYADNEELVKKVLPDVESRFTQYKSDRKQFEDIWEVSDYMYKAAQNRSINTTEMEKGANLPDEERANVGSTLYYRIVNQGASQGFAVQASRDMPFKYEPIFNENVDYSIERGNQYANQLNMLAKWTMKKDRFNKKSIDFWAQLLKYSNTPVMIYQKVDRGIRSEAVPVYEQLQGPNGEVQLIQTGTKIVSKEYIVNNYPSFRVLHNAMVYMDSYTGDMQDQSCVVVQTLRNKADIWDDVVNGFFSKQAYDKLDDSFLWDGYTGSEFRQELMDNNDTTYAAKNNGQYLQWDIFYRCPVNNGKYDENAVPLLHFITVIGNSINGGICVRFERNPDPDDEIPIEMIHENPDDSDLAYHVASAQIIRSNYSVECTLKGLAIDNMALVNNPPLMYLEGMHHIRDFRYKKGALWPVLDQNAIREFEPRDTTLSTVNLLNYVQDDSMRALNAGKNSMGQEFGGRTSASEAVTINKYSLQPNLVKVRYILEQFLGWYARKLKSYWQKYADPRQVVAITSENMYYNIRPAEIHGDFDVDISIVDDYEDDIVKEQKIFQAIQLIGSSPAFQQSATHQLDIGELLKEWMKRSGLYSPKIIKPPMGVDSARVARIENESMMQGGVQVDPQPGENHSIHIAEHKGERLRYNGVEEQFPNVQILDLHIAKTEMLMQSESGMPGSVNGNPNQMGPEQVPGATGNETPGEVTGNETAAAMGAMMGGAQ